MERSFGRASLKFLLRLGQGPSRPEGLWLQAQWRLNGIRMFEPFGSNQNSAFWEETNSKHWVVVNEREQNEWNGGVVRRSQKSSRWFVPTPRHVFSGESSWKNLRTAAEIRSRSLAPRFPSSWYCFLFDPKHPPFLILAIIFLIPSVWFPWKLTKMNFMFCGKSKFHISLGV